MLDRLEAEGLGAGARADPALRRARAARHRRARGARRRRARQGGVAARRRGGRPLRVVCDDVRRADRPGRSLRCSASAPRRRRRSTCPASCRGEMIGAYALSRVGLRLGRAQREGARRAAARRQLPAERREDVDHQRRLRRSLHRVCQGRATRRRPRVRTVHRLPRRARVPRRQHRQGRTQDGPARLVHDAADPAGRAGAGGERARRDRQGPQGRVQRPELRPFQAGGDVQRRRAAGHRAGGGVRRRSASSSASPSPRSARSATSSPR